MLTFLIDADMIVFESCSSVETPIDWGDDIWTLHANAADAKAQVDDRVGTMVALLLDKLNYEGDYHVIMCFSDPKENFRKSILSTYKANRTGKRKPICYQAVMEWVLQNYDYDMRPGLEADDCVGILATLLAGQEIHISGDKDFRSIPGVFYDFLHNEIHHISEEEADKWFYMQCLIGDTADNYTGCPGIGPKTAEKLFEKEGATWETVQKQYIRKGYGEDYALQQARVARILRNTDINPDNTPRLWSPKSPSGK